MNEKIRALKREHEMPSLRLCKVTKQRKKVEEDRTIVEEEKRVMATRLEEMI